MNEPGLKKPLQIPIAALFLIAAAPLWNHRSLHAAPGTPERVEGSSLGGHNPSAGDPSWRYIPAAEAPGSIAPPLGLPNRIQETVPETISGAGPAAEISDAETASPDADNLGAAAPATVAKIEKARALFRAQEPVSDAPQRQEAGGPSQFFDGAGPAGKDAGTLQTPDAPAGGQILGPAVSSLRPTSRSPERAPTISAKIPQPKPPRWTSAQNGLTAWLSLLELKAKSLLGLIPAPRRFFQAQAIDSNRPTVVIFGRPSAYNLSMLNEGAKQSPGDVHLVLDFSWLSSETSPDGREIFFLKKGLVFDGSGLKLVEYAHPRLVRRFDRLAGQSLSGEDKTRRMADILADARRDALRGKRLLMFWMDYDHPETYALELAKKLGAEVVIIDDASSKAKALAHDLIAADMQDPEKSYPQILDGARAYVKSHGAFDGIVNFWEDTVPLAARLASDLGLQYHSVSAAASARSKHRTRAIMKAAGLRTPQFWEISSRQELEKVLRGRLDYPMILKPSFGIEAWSVVKVHTAAEALAAYDKIFLEIGPNTDPIYNQGREVLFEQYLDGEEVDVDLLMQGGKFVYDSITGNWPTNEPLFIPTGVTEPSDLPLEKQQALIDLAKQAALALGFKDGVLHIEEKYTSTGPQLLEVNARMVGLWGRKWKQTVWGVDLVEQELLIRAGIPVSPYKSPKPLAYLAGEFFTPSVNGVFEGLEGADEVKASKGFFDILILKRPGEKVSVPPQAYKRLYMISASGATPEEAQSALEAMRSKVRARIRPEK